MNVFKIARVVGSDDRSIDLVLYEALDDGSRRLHESSATRLLAQIIGLKAEVAQLRKSYNDVCNEQIGLIAERDKFEQALRTALAATTDEKLAEALRKALDE